MTDTETAEPDRLDVCVVMPVYNEEEIVAEVARSWLAVLGGLDIRYELLAIVDGATDASEQALRAVAEQHPELVVRAKPNSGHGPTVLQGYRRAAAIADWVFQTDSDNEIPAESFGRLWHQRCDHDAVMGIRSGRSQSPGRWAITRLARLTVRAAYGCRLADVNCPFRLMRSTVLAPLLPLIPDHTFAPNAALSGLLSKSGARLAQAPVPYRDRTTGSVSILGFGAVRAALRSFAQLTRLSRIPVPERPQETRR